MWKWFHKFGSPRWFYQISGKIIPWLALLTIVLLLTGSVWGLLYAPEDFRQGNSFRIIYIHVPAAVVALAAYYIMAIAGAINLVWRMKLADVALKSTAVIGAALTFLALFTGAVWGKPTWGTYWVWDARITSMLVLFFLYVGIVALHSAYDDKVQGGKACAILALVGTVNIPIIYKSVDWWNSLHQPATIKFTEKSTIAPEMFYPLLIMITGFYCLFGLSLLLYSRAEILQREWKTKWVRELLQQEGRL